MHQSFFAYGSFAENQVHYKNFSNFIKNTQKAWIKAEAYRLRCGYPVLYLENKNDMIEGHLFELEVTENFWSIQDELLGVDPSNSQPTMLQRRKISVVADGGETVEAWTYCLHPDKQVQTQEKIAEGLWQKNMREKPPLLNYLESKHCDYLDKLSKAKGRELVPYKLDVYRRLMSMELIKDKGRRPALTTLGQEVSLFLQ